MREFLAQLFFGDIREIARLSAENNVLNLRVETLAADNEILRQRLDRLMDINLVHSGRIPLNDPTVAQEYGFDRPTKDSDEDQRPQPGNMRDYQRVLQNLEDRVQSYRS